MNDSGGHLKFHRSIHQYMKPKNLAKVDMTSPDLFPRYLLRILDGDKTKLLFYYYSNDAYAEILKNYNTL